MCNTITKEGIIKGPASPRQCVKNGNPEVIAYLSEVFGNHRLYYCRPGDECLFVCPRMDMSFEVVEPLECFFDKDNSRKGKIAPGIYQIIAHVIMQKCHSLLLQNDEDGKTLKCQAGWTNGFMVDWRGIRPTQDK